MEPRAGIGYIICKVSEVAGLVGIEDPYYFSRLFKRVHGISPTGYRASGDA